ncbi:MAG: AI-2E family transporter [Methylococcales bacterium]|jgi:putative permease|nr:AI-2E family transporter [Methylococcales bacterium]MBT7444145.1 AI-2E family transporter [Methylococcales bacterium]
MDLVTNWFKRYFSDPQVIFLALIITLVFTVVISTADMLGPVFAAIVIAYLLEGVVHQLQRLRLPRMFSVLCVFTGFVAFLSVMFFVIMPLLSRQVTDLIAQTPGMVAKGQQSLLMLPEQYPELLTEEQVGKFINTLRTQVAELNQLGQIWDHVLSSFIGVITVGLYTVLVPMMVFFFLKDKTSILNWLVRFFPRERSLATGVWRDVDLQIANYVRGKFWEIVIVGLATYIAFEIMQFHYAVLLSVLVGLSVIIPYIGAVVVTIPVAIIAYFQWGWSSEAAYLMLVYGIIQAIDGNVLVPLLFSEVVNLHPVAIVVAILLFGGLWGLWGVFFAIPLATLVQAVITAWPTWHDLPNEETQTL